MSGAVRWMKWWWCPVLVDLGRSLDAIHHLELCSWALARTSPQPHIRSAQRPPAHAPPTPTRRHCGPRVRRVAPTRSLVGSTGARVLEAPWWRAMGGGVFGLKREEGECQQHRFPARTKRALRRRGGRRLWRMLAAPSLPWGEGRANEKRSGELRSPKQAYHPWRDLEVEPARLSPRAEAQGPT